MSTTTLVTAEQLLHMPRDGHRYELVAGELRKMAPAGWEHGDVGGWLNVLMAEYIRTNRPGKIFLAETGFLLSRGPDTVRAPDIAFIRKDHLPAERPLQAFWPGPPDLAVEVVSPGDTYREVAEKVEAWLAAGAMLVWVVDPQWRTVTVHRPGAELRTLTEKDELSGEDVLPGFRCRVGEIFNQA
jgi:Uma2 family endonuclease